MEASSEVRSTVLLSSLVQTRSMELVLAPIASQVSQLVILLEAQGRTPLADLMPSALSVMEAVQNLADVAQRITAESVDEQLQADMPVAYMQALAAGESLLEAGGRLLEDPCSQEGRLLLLSGSQEVLEGTMKVLLVWDDAEVRKIIRTAHWVLDRLGLVKAAKSMRGLVITFGGFSESLLLLLNLADKRQKELTDPERKQKLLAALENLKEAIPKFSTASQDYVKHPNSTPAKESRDALAGEISSAVHDLIDSVKIYEDFYPESEATENMAANIMEVQRQLAPDTRYFIGPELDKYLDAIIQNSMAVAHVSRDQLREAILGLCNEVLSLRKQLGDNLAAVYGDPESEEARSAFDHTAEQLCEKLCELDRWVADAVVDQVTETFVETAAPINHLVQAATAASPIPTPPSTPPSTTQLSDQDSLRGLTQQVELFRRHSRRLSQVAAYAAQSSTDSKRVQVIKDLAEDIDQLTPKVVEAAMRVKKEPGSKVAKEQLDSSRREWAGKVQQLTGAIDDIIDPEDFLAVSEVNIHEDMAKCRDAVYGGKWAELAGIVHGIAAKARRVAEVGRAQVAAATEPRYQRSLDATVKRLERAIPKMVSLTNDLIHNPTSQDSRDQFVLSLRELLESIHQIQGVIRNGPSLIEEPEPPAGDQSEIHPEEPQSTSTPLATVQERMTRKRIEQLKGQSRYIGSLGGASRGKTTRRVLPTPPTKTGGTQTAPESIDEPDISSFRVSPRRQDSIISYSEGFSHSYSSGDAETQTPRHRTRDQSIQADMQYPSATFGSSLVSPTLSTGSWATPSSNPPMGGAKPKGSPTDRTVRSYVSPLHKLVTAAKTGDTDRLPSHASALSARAIRLAGIAESAAGTLKKDGELYRVLQTKASEVSKLTPRVIEQAEQLAKNPQTREAEELQMTSHQWAGHVRQLIDATQQANLPWSKTARGLATAAKSGEGLQAQMKHVSTQTARLVDVATTTLEAAETEDAIGSTSESEPSQDPELQEQVQRVKVTMSEIQKLTPQLLDAAELASLQEEGSAAAEHLNLLSQEWATKARILMKSVDDVTLGMGGPADTLFISAKSGDSGLLEEQSKAIRSLASSLQDIAHDAVAGCTESERVEVVHGTAKNLEQLSSKLIGCAREVGGAHQVEGEGEPPQATMENTEILRRDWASQVHLLVAHIDALTAEVAAPLDRLVDIALQASRTTSLAKQHLLAGFEKKAAFISEKLEEVNTQFTEATVTMTADNREQALDNALKTILFLKKLTPHAVGAARSLATEPGSAMLDHFNHLRRQWASKAQFLLANLRDVTTADMQGVLAAFEELIHQSKSVAAATPPRRDGSGSSLPMSYSTEGIADKKSAGFEDIEIRKPSTPSAKPRSRPSSQYSDSDDGDMGKMMLKPAHQTKRPSSMHVPLPSWVSGSDEVPSVSSQSIAVAAQSLQELADEFLEEGNPIITVAKKMSQQMFQMAEFTRGRGELQSKMEMIHTAKAIAGNGQAIVQFANIISEQCTDKRIKANLQYCAEMIPTLSTQLRIIASVKASTPDDISADVMLVKNAQNLMQAVTKTMQAAEAACMKGLKPPEDSEQTEAAALALSWKRKLYLQRSREAITAPLGARGLRKLSQKRISTPTLVDMLKSSGLQSPTSP